MAFDPVSNFGYGTVAVAPTPATSGVTFSMQPGEGDLFPDPAIDGDFNLTLYPPSTGPLLSNAEIWRIIGRSGSDFTGTREQEGTSAKSVAVGWQVAFAPTAKTMQDIFDAINAIAPGTGTVTSVSVTPANGVSGSVSNPTTTPAITLTLEAITPSSVAASGNVTGANLSGTNTGDQTNISGNAGTATALQTARNINGVAFNGTANITVTADANTLTGTALPALNGSALTNLDASDLASGTVPAGRMPALTGDVTTSAGAVATTIANDAVTYAKMQNVSAASKLLGRGDSGSGDVQEISLGAGLTMTGTTLSAAGGGASDRLSILTASEISITGTATATIGRLHVCSGTTSDYTVTLPAASGNADRYIAFRMAPGLTKLVTIDGNGGELIDGLASRIMWANETAELYCDGSAWTKVAGKSIPMECVIHLSTNQAGIANGVITKAQLDTTDVDNTGLMADLANNQITIVRFGSYFIVGTVIWNSVAAGANYYSIVRVNGADDFTLPGYFVTGYPSTSALAPSRVLAIGDDVSLAALQSSGISQTLYGAASDTTKLWVAEIPSW